MRVLVVDDYEDDLLVFENILTAHGYIVNKALDSDIALHLLKKFEFDIILLDILMPGMDGRELCKIIREESNKGTKIAYVTVLAKDQVNLDCVDGFIQKPFSKSELLETISRIIDA